MRTLIEVYLDGSRMVFHATDGGKEKWQHRPENAKECRVCRTQATDTDSTTPKTTT